MNVKKNYPSSPRVRIIQKLYGSLINPDQEIIYTKSQYRKFIKDVVSGTLERKELIEETIIKNLSDDIIISEYLKAAEFFLEPIQIKYLNAILDKISKIIRKNDI